MSNSIEIDTPLCKAGTTMYMDGFHFSLRENKECLIFLFDGLVLNNRIKVIFACIFTLALAVAMESLVFLRKSLLERDAKKKLSFLGKSRISLLYGLHLSFAYFLMLLAMTYSIELFSSVVVGLCLGKLLWSQNTIENEDKRNFQERKSCKCSNRDKI